MSVVDNQILVGALRGRKIIQLSENVPLAQARGEKQARVRGSDRRLHQIFDALVRLLQIFLAAQTLRQQGQPVKGVRKIRARGVLGIVGQADQPVASLVDLILRRIIFRLDEVRRYGGIRARVVVPQSLERLQCRGLPTQRQFRPGLQEREDAGDFDSQRRVYLRRPSDLKVDQPERLGGIAAVERQPGLQPRHSRAQLGLQLRGAGPFSQQARDPGVGLADALGALQIERARQAPLSLPAILQVKRGIVREFIDHLAGIGRTRPDLRQDALKHELGHPSRSHHRPPLPQDRRIGIGGASIIARAKPRLRLDHAQVGQHARRDQRIGDRTTREDWRVGTRLGAARGGRNLSPGFVGIIRSQPVAALFPGGLRQQGPGVNAETGDGEILQQGVGLALGAWEVGLREGELRAEKPGRFEQGRRRPAGEQPVEFGAELAAFRLLARSLGEQLQRLTLALEVETGLQQLHERRPPGAVSRPIPDESEHETQFVPGRAFLRRGGGQHPLQALHRLVAPTAFGQHHRVVSGGLVTDGLTGKLPGVLLRLPQIRLRGFAEQAQPHALSSELETRPRHRGRRQLLGLHIKLIRPPLVARRGRVPQRTGQKPVPGDIVRRHVRLPDRVPMRLRRRALVQLQGREGGPQAPRRTPLHLGDSFEHRRGRRGFGGVEQRRGPREIESGAVRAGCVTKFLIQLRRNRRQPEILRPLRRGQGHADRDRGGRRGLPAQWRGGRCNLLRRGRRRQRQGQGETARRKMREKFPKKPHVDGTLSPLLETINRVVKSSVSPARHFTSESSRSRF